MPVVEETEEGHRFYAEAIRHDLFCTAIALFQFPEEFQCCDFVSRLVTTASSTSTS